ncbi:MAG: hypothetical protein KIS94_11950 [Chitinophagales bacterium]|nr:hypothetical protein [Chitinophagales bacterium]
MAIKFGIIAEGITDVWTIESIVEGVFNDGQEDDLAITTPLQPKTLGDPGSYTLVFDFLKSGRLQQFLEEPNSYAIIHLDTDTVGLWSEYPFPHEIKEVIQKIPRLSGRSHDKISEAIQVIIEFIFKIIGKGANTIANRLVFAIAINEIECWILTLHSCKRTQDDKIVACLDSLNRNGFTIDPNNKAIKNGQFFRPAIRGFMKRTEIERITTKNKSLDFFLQQLNKLY